MNDLRTVMWKELRELRGQSSEFGAVGTAVGVVLVLAVVGAMAASAGREAVHTFVPLLIALIPALGVMAPICESFAGERERHTLETLLASRVSSEALLMGKILVFVLYSWTASLLLVAFFIAGANAPTLTTPWALPRVTTVVGLVLVMPLLLLFLSTAGALLSLRAATARQAASRLIIFIFGLFVPIVLIDKFVPLSQIRFVQQLLATEHGRLQAMLGCALIVAAADLVLVFLAWSRFQRDRLIEIR